MKQIPNFPSYCVTKDGRVWSKKRLKAKGGWVKQHFNSAGYLNITLSERGKPHQRMIHLLVLETYVGPCPKSMEARHLDGNKLNNKLGNLKWGTRSENQLDAVRHGTAQGLKNTGSKHGCSKLFEGQVRLIFNAYHNRGFTQKRLADYFGVSRSTIGNITSKKLWRYLWDE